VSSLTNVRYFASQPVIRIAVRRGVKVNRSHMTCARISGRLSRVLSDRDRSIAVNSSDLRVAHGYRSHDRSAPTLYAGYQIEVRNCRNINGFPIRAGRTASSTNLDDRSSNLARKGAGMINSVLPYFRTSLGVPEIPSVH
jgi:hypothetical protein